MDERAEQLELCIAHEVHPDFPSGEEKLGVALATLGQRPLNGLRHPPENGTCGWYLWGGEEMSEEADFFQPVHVGHMAEVCPDAVPFLALPPGWRFLVGDGVLDVWYDADLHNV